MLWNLIRDYFVQYIFGGITSNGTYITASLGRFGDNGRFTYEWPIDIGDVSYSLGDYLSTTATIITIIIIVVLCGLFIKKMVSSVSNLLTR